MINRWYAAIVLGVAALLSAGTYFLHQQNSDYRLPALCTGIGVMAMLSLISYYMVARKLAARPQAFVHGVMSTTFLKMAVCIGLVLVYALGFRQQFHKPTLFILFGIYAVFTVIETSALSRLAKRRN